MPVSLPKGVEVKQANGTITVKGPKGQMDMTPHADMTVVIEEGEATWFDQVEMALRQHRRNMRDGA